jgi:hypothetical protein
MIPALIFLGLILASAGCLLEREPQQNGENPLQSLEFTDYVGVNDYKDTFVVFGQARNTGELPIRSVRLRIDYQDRNRTTIASQVYDEEVLILPHESWKFEFVYTGPDVPKIFFYYITPLRVEFVR